MPRLPRSPTLARIEAALRDHPLRTSSGVEKLPRLPRAPLFGAGHALRRGVCVCVWRDAVTPAVPCALALRALLC
eukprot:1751350-Pyramimonas_sp.AAC.1